MIKLYGYVFRILILIFLSQNHLFSKTIVVDENLKNMQIGSYLEYIDDAEGKYSFDDVKGKALEGKWIESKTDRTGFGFTESVFWVRFLVENKTGMDREIFLEQAYPLIDSIILYVLGKNKTSILETGDLKPFNERPYINRNFIFPLTLKAMSKQVFYLRYKSQSSMNIALSIWSPDKFRESSFSEYLFLTFYYGIVFVMIIYNFFVFIFIRRIEYLYYVLFVLFFIIFIMMQHGTAYQFLWPGFPWWANYFIPVSLCFVLIFAILFSRDFLFNKEIHKWMYKITQFILYISYGVTILCMFLHYKISMVLSSGLTGVAISWAVFAGAWMAIKKNRNAYFYTSAWLAFLVGALAYILKNFGVLPTNIFTVWAFQIGSAVEVVLLSFALADRINVLRRGLQKANTELRDLNENLEKKVLERTEELMSSNEELAATNQRLTETRDALWGEMELAKKIQTVLLPVKPEIPGYDIAVYMEPAEEVGGDYYDVISAGGYDWVVIGDVSGHGVPAGLIMMMAQTSINLVLDQEPDVLPSRLLTIINRTISKNIRLMGEDKYMTMTVLAVLNAGKLSFSGLHQDILVYRAGTGTVEPVETEGIWIGVLDDIEGMNSDSSLSIEKGDVFLLYTDGITEAWKKEAVNKDEVYPEDMFGDDRLAEVFKKFAPGTPEEIRDGILNELKEYSCPDDVTLVVLKRSV